MIKSLVLSCYFREIDGPLLALLRRLSPVEQGNKKDVYPLPRIDDILHCLHGAKYFSCIDLRAGYLQISVDEAVRKLRSSHLTAFLNSRSCHSTFVMRPPHSKE